MSQAEGKGQESVRLASGRWSLAQSDDEPEAAGPGEGQT